MLWTAPPRHESAIQVGAVRTSHDSEEPGHANDYDRWSRYREVSVSGSWRRCEWQRGFLSPAQTALCSDVLSEAAAVGIEACASSHYWSRELQALGHTVRLMPPAYVKPYVKRHKNDAAEGSGEWPLFTRSKWL